MKKGAPTSVRFDLPVDKGLRTASEKTGVHKTLLVEAALRLYLDQVVKTLSAEVPFSAVETESAALEPKMKTMMQDSASDAPSSRRRRRRA